MLYSVGFSTFARTHNAAQISATPTGFHVTEAAVSRFRKLMLAVFGSGALAGLALFSVQHFTVIPLIQTAETYEAAHSDAAHQDQGWQPTEGWERTSFTALTTMLTEIGFAAMLFGVMALAGETIDIRHGALGLAAFACFSLAPALGLPPQPPGVAVADLHRSRPAAYFGSWRARLAASSTAATTQTPWACLLLTTHE